MVENDFRCKVYLLEFNIIYNSTRQNSSKQVEIPEICIRTEGEEFANCYKELHKQPCLGN